MNEILPILNMFLQQNLFRKRYFQNLKKILKKFKRIQKNQRTHLTQKKLHLFIYWTIIVLRFWLINQNLN